MASFKDYTLAGESYLKTGGITAFFYAPESIDEAKEAMRKIHTDKISFFILGEGTNSLVSDEYWPGAVISLKNLKEITLEENTITAGAGTINSDLTQFALDHELTGAEWMHRLPGQLGGTVRMNARCYGGEISQITSRVISISPEGDLLSYSNTPDSKKIFQGYKDTIFMKRAELIVEADLKLSPGKKDSIKEKMKFCENDRVSKGQFLHPSCGCTFKNDYSQEVSVPSGLLLELAHAKAFKVGNATISPNHANFIFNQGASSSDIIELSLEMRESVWKEFGVWLEYEMEILGKIPEKFATQILSKRPPLYKIARLREAQGIFTKKTRS